MNRQSSFFSLLWFLARPWLHTFPSLTIAFILSQTMPPTHKERPSAMKRSNGGSNVALSKRTTRNSPAIEDAASTKLTEESPKPEPPPLKGSVKPLSSPQPRLSSSRTTKPNDCSSPILLQMTTTTATYGWLQQSISTTLTAA